VRAWRIVVDRFPQQRLTIIGAEAVPAYAASIRTLIAELQLAEHVRLEGVASDERKIEALEAAELFLFPSGEEGWGIALAEAMRAGLPCVTYDLPIFDELFPRGRLAAPLGDFRALAARAIELLDSEHVRLRYAAEALDLAHTFTWQRAADAEAALIASLLRSGRFRYDVEEV
jgi:glycosyltransferase involved in cell wall biosynthesis